MSISTGSSLNSGIRWPSRGEGPLFRAMTSVPGLAAGWMRVLANAGASGSDGETVEGFMQGAERRIGTLAQDLADGTYRPQPPRVIRLPKKQGGERILRVPSVRDRVAQTAAALVLSPVLEATFEDSSFGYRPGRSIQAAAKRIAGLRQSGLEWVVETDIDDFFDSIPHGRLLSKLEAAIGDTDVLRLVTIWLESAEPDGVGIAQGSPLSPLLANLYLDAVDEALAGDDIALVRYADDFVILCRTREVAADALARAIAVLRAHDLMLDADKTRITSYDDGFKFLGHAFCSTGVLYASDPYPKPAKAEAVSVAAPQRSEPIDEPMPPMEPSVIEQAELDRGRPAEGRHAERSRRLYLMGQGVRLRTVGETFRVYNGAEPVADVAPERLDQIELGPAAAIETEAVRHALRHKVAVDLVDGRGALLGRVEAACQGRASRVLAQARARLDEQMHRELVRAFVTGRIRNQRALLHRLNRRRGSPLVAQTAVALGRVLRKLAPGQDIARMRGHEGEAARLYWPALGSVLGDFRFTQRVRGGEGGAANVVLDVLAGLLQRDIRILVARAGLHPGIGFLHEQATGDWSLASDLVEEFRAPIVESLTCYLFNNRFLSAASFESDEATSSIRLGASALSTVIRQFERTMERAVRSPRSRTETSWRGVIEDQIDHLIDVLENRDPGAIILAYRAYPMDY